MNVSIVVPVFNVPPHLLAECLSAVGRQTLRAGDHEILLIDDGSTTAEVADALASFATARDNCRVIRHETNRGLNQARLTGVRESQGEFVLFVDGDDILTRDAAELLYHEAIRTSADVVTAPVFRWSAETFSYELSPSHQRPYPPTFLERMKAALGGTYSFSMCGRLFRRSLLHETVFDMPDGLPHEDLVTTVRVLFDADRTSAIAEPIYYYTINDSSISEVFTTRHLDGLFYALGDWHRQAEAHAMAAELERALREGADRLVNTFVLRCVRSTNLSAEEKLSELREMDRRYDSLPGMRAEPAHPGTRLLARIGSADIQDPELALQLVDEPVPSKPWSASSRYERTLGPSDMAMRLKGKVVFIGQVDYQVRNAARLAAALRQRGRPCVVLDNSAIADKGLRRYTSGEPGLFYRIEHIKVTESPYGVDWLSTASLVVVFNDLGSMFREALEYRHRLGLPTACMIEGINDFWRVDFSTPRQLPYRRGDYVFLAGADDERYFADRPTFVVGMPNVAALARVAPQFPSDFHAVLNVNFTYGALEGKRTEFIRAAQAAFDELGVSWEITRHPMDEGDLTGLPVSTSTQQQLIDRCSVFVSRFATGILEALASGKPVIYFNPHGEQVPKFSEPLGAYEIARTSGELAAALRRVEDDIAAGIDFRARAAPFLQRHAAFGLPDGKDVGTRFAEAAATVLDAHEARLAAASDFFLDRLDEWTSFRQERPGLVLGDFARVHGAQLNEEEMVGLCLGSGEGLMIDVGANFGNSSDVYLGKGWAVHAFEPDPNNRANLELLWPGCERLVIRPEAVSDQDGQMVPLFASDESTGVSSLSAFTGGHRQVAEVPTVTLATYMRSAAIEHVDFLKVDVEGFDKFVLDGFPWDADRPEAILVEFEDAKTVPLGYNVGDLVEILQRHGYTVYVSEWHPIIRYGIAHDWKSLSRYDPAVDLSGTWGNLVAFRADPGVEVLERAAISSTRFAVRAARPSTAAPAVTPPQARAPLAAKGGQPPSAPSGSRTPRRRRMLQRWRQAWTGKGGHSPRWLYRQIAKGAREGMPTAYSVARLGAWGLRAMRRHWAATAVFAAAILVAALLPVVANEPDWRLWSWSVAAALIVAAGTLALRAGVGEAIRRAGRRRDRRLNAVIAAQASSHAAAIARARTAVDAIRDEAARTTERHERQARQLQDELDSLRVRLAAMQEAAAAERRRSTDSNAPGFIAHDRYFSPDDAAHVRSYWMPRFQLATPTSQLMYLAHDICRSEDRCEGRLATTIQAAVIRSLALMSLGSRDIELLEIGTLFGIGAGALYRTGVRAGQRVRLTLIDPLNGYYNVSPRDSTTGVPVTVDVLSRNLESMSVAESDVRLVIGRSDDEAVLAEASDRAYDYVLIDGDHSLEGVTADFGRYGGLVRPGGLLVFDDYDTTDWPHIKTFVDRHVLGNPEWECLGMGWRTAVFARAGTELSAGSGVVGPVARGSQTGHRRIGRSRAAGLRP